MAQVTVGGYTFTYDHTSQGNKWYYHPDGTAVIGFDFDAEEWYSKGFCDTPDDFDKESDSDGIELEDWDRKKIRSYALEIFGVNLHQSLSKSRMIEKVKELEQNGNVQATD